MACWLDAPGNHSLSHWFDHSVKLNRGVCVVLQTKILDKMTLKKIIKITGDLSLLVWLVIGWMLFLGKSVQAGDNGALGAFNTTQPYLIYYGNWTTAQVNYARTNYHLVILHPASNINSNQIATIKSGKDGILGTADDVRVLAYLSVGEDDRNGAPVAGDRMGPRVDPRALDGDPAFQHHQRNWFALGGRHKLRLVLS